MKTNIKIFTFLAAAILTFGSCDDFLDTSSLSKLTPDLVFDNNDMAYRALLGVYDCLTADATYSQDLSIIFGAGSDMEFRSFSYSASMTYVDEESRAPAHYTATNTNSKVQRVWVALFQCIERANLIIKNVEESRIYNDPSDQYNADFRSYRAEAIALRAMCYMELVRNWGNVPLNLEPTQSADDLKPKTDRMDIMSALIPGLIEAAADLPWKQPTSERCTQGFARGLAARLALYRAGYDFTKDARWVEPRSDAGDYYRIAMEQTAIVKQSGQYLLEDTFQTYFYKQCQRTYSDETLYEIGFFLGGSSEMGYSVGVRYAVNSAYGYSTQGVLTTSPMYYYSFHPSDERRDVSAVYYSYDNLSSSGIESTSGVSRSLYTNGYDWRINKWDIKWCPEDFHILSGINNQKTGTGINFPIMRYSDILLMYAEAAYHVEGRTTEAKDALWQVRKRAIPSLTVAEFDSYLNGKDFLQAVKDERKWEFAGEAMRKFDLIRWGEIVSAMRTMRDEVTILAEDYEYDFEFKTLPNGIQRALPESLWYRYDENGEDFDDVNIDYIVENQPSAAHLLSSWMYNTYQSSSSAANNRERLINTYRITNAGLLDYNNNPVANGRPFQPVPASVITDYQGRMDYDYGFVF